MAAPRTGTLATSIVGRLRSLAAVELFADYLALNTHIVFCQVWFMGRLVRQQSWQLIKGESPYERSYGETPRPRVMRYAPRGVWRSVGRGN